MNRKAMPIVLATAFLVALLGASGIAFAGEEVTNASVTLDSPLADSYNNSAAPNVFVWTTTINGTAPAEGYLTLSNCSLWTNISGSWVMNESNATMANNTVSNTSVTGLTESSASYIWNVNCSLNNSQGTSYVASSNRTTMFDRGVPNITISRPNDAETFTQNPGLVTFNSNESVNVSIHRVRVNDTDGTLENQNISNRTTTSTNYNFVFQTLNTLYWFEINATDQAGNGVVGSNYSFWYNVTTSTGGGGGRTVKKLPTVVDEVPAEVPAEEVPAVVPPVGPLATATAVLSDVGNAIVGVGSTVVNAIVGFFQSLLGL